MTLDVPYKKQKAYNTCGATCMEMIFSYYGVNIKEDEIVNELLIKSNQSGRKYIRTIDIVNFAISRGFQAFFSHMNRIEDLYKTIDDGLPMIVLQRVTVKDEMLAHFRVVKGYKNKTFMINDPENQNNQVIPQDTFIKLWKKQLHGENQEENVFILIYPNTKKMDFSKYNYKAISFNE